MLLTGASSAIRPQSSGWLDEKINLKVVGRYLPAHAYGKANAITESPAVVS